MQGMKKQEDGGCFHSDLGYMTPMTVGVLGVCIILPILIYTYDVK